MEKKQRGRPRAVPLGWLRELRRMHPRIHTDRQLQNLEYARSALTILGLIPEGRESGLWLPPATWLVDWESANQGKQGAVKWSVLEQLGRMSAAGLSDESVRQFAAAVEKRRMNAKDTAASLRRVRLHME